MPWRFRRPPNGAWAAGPGLLAWAPGFGPGLQALVLVEGSGFSSGGSRWVGDREDRGDRAGREDPVHWEGGGLCLPIGNF